MFIFFIILTAVSFFMIQFIPTIPKSTQIEFHCNRAIDLKFCPSKMDHCAADLFLQKSNLNRSNEYTFDVSVMKSAIQMPHADRNDLNNPILFLFPKYK